jgi:2,3-dihydroxyphenylpropionate 1,2-dioxygenase
MTLGLVCASHSPIMMIRAKPPEREPEILAAYEARKAAIEAFDPELVIVFGTDHYFGFHLELMPSYCIGTACRSVGDVGGFAGTFDVPGATALALADHLVGGGFDPCVAQNMTVDHGFSQPMHRLLGGVDRYAVIPVFINALTPPLPRYRRIRELGEAIGGFARSLDRRVLFLGSGGMSHHPTRYYPPPGEATPDVAAYQMSGAAGGSFSDEAWLERLYVMHQEGAHMLVDGRRTNKDIRLNVEADRAFLDILCAGELTRFDAWQGEELVPRAGVGFNELLTWIAATAAHMAPGGDAPTLAVYADTLEYGIGFGMVYAGAAA